jgi:hypothetical protein
MLVRTSCHGASGAVTPNNPVELTFLQRQQQRCGTTGQSRPSATDMQRKIETRFQGEVRGEASCVRGCCCVRIRACMRRFPETITCILDCRMRICFRWTSELMKTGFYLWHRLLVHRFSWSYNARCNLQLVSSWFWVDALGSLVQVVHAAFCTRYQKSPPADCLDRRGKFCAQTHAF